ncbi:MAG: helix-turn-helix transcriptional regulator [Clostridia bacterium]|jgi:transcriptional regulator with XRE-family HTH domain|nr:helix-turn-helix transcriptional regulator [Clostridia bacterium]
MISVEKIRKRLQEAIKQSGMTQTQIAKKIGVRQQTIANYLHQNKMPALDTFANLCKVLEVDTNYILCQE